MPIARVRPLLLSALLALASASSVPAAFAAAGFRSVTPDIDQVESEIVDQTNEFRAGEGLPRLPQHPVLAEEALAFAEYLARTGAFSHTADGSDPGARAQAAGYVFCVLTENIAFEEFSRGALDEHGLAAAIVHGWEASPGHRRNMLGADVVETGVGVAVSPRNPDRYLAVQVFGRPISLRTDFAVVNRSQSTVSYAYAGRRQRLTPGMTAAHSSCAPSSVAFEAGGPSLEPENGATYLVTTAPSGHIAVKVVRHDAAAGPAFARRPS